jgi:hypothetical protein
MSEVDRLSNSGLYPALPIADKRSSRDGSGGTPRGKQPADSSPSREGGSSPGSPQPPKSLIDEYA